ncbi:MAG: putative methyl-accepting chemotaxis protein [Candidatus Scalindua rubra]|uniref:Putative methyl-accepting chemotaxis protein n=1 Tax=Candidatus Scalindua rubra TaxID=1872076 RepID=A0A1E3XFN8_9BACT|nr:MAG: putative methyl-accepting chemotaxis protein [Candidatus Scalindua rubra]
MITRKIINSVGIAFFIFLVTVPLVSYKYLKNAVKIEAFNHLITARELMKSHIEGYFQDRFGDVDVLARNPVIGQGFSRLSKAYSVSGLESLQYIKLAGLYQPLMEHYLSDYGYVNVYFVNKNGDVIYSAIKEEFTGTNLLTGKFKQFSIGQVFARGLDGVAFEDYTWHYDLGEFTSYFSAPVYDGQMLLGVLIMEIPFSHLDTMLTHRAGLGQTGEMYLVGEDGFMRSNSRFVKEPTILQKEVDTEGTREALNGISGTKIIRDYRGVPVLSAYTPLDLKFVNWVLMVEIREAEAFASIKAVERRLMILGSIIGCITILYIYLTSRKERHRISEPVEESKT